MIDKKEVVDAFYESFARRDGEAMAALYSDDITFSDPVFPLLKGQDAKDMWRMLCGRAADLKVDFTREWEEETSAFVSWNAYYTFTKSGRKVHNRVLGQLWVANGKIVKHEDHFSFWKWSAQALGPAGVLLGWSPWLKASVRKEALRGLTAFQEKETGRR